MAAENPKISVITPSFNQAPYLIQCIRSIHEQGYGNIEHLLFDGGSTDDSIAVIKRYESTLTHWETGPDGGQAAAINKGLARAGGDILCWVNSDDGLLAGALDVVVNELATDVPAWLVGGSVSINSKGKRTKRRLVADVSTTTFLRYKEFWLPQPSVFWNRAMQERIGVLAADLEYVMDLDFFFRMHCVAKPVITSEVLSFYTVHGDAKTTAAADKVDREYSTWLADRIDSGEMQLDDILREFIHLQRCHRTVTEHVVLSRVMRFWHNYVNPRLYI